MTQSLNDSIFSAEGRRLTACGNLLPRPFQILPTRLFLKLDRSFPLVQAITIALGHTADLAYGPFIQAQALGNLFIGETTGAVGKINLDIALKRIAEP